MASTLPGRLTRETFPGIFSYIVSEGEHKKPYISDMGDHFAKCFEKFLKLRVIFNFKTIVS